MKTTMLLAGGFLLSAFPVFAQAKLPIENKGLSVSQAIRTGAAGVSETQGQATVFLKLANPNSEPVEIRNTICQFHQDGHLVKQLSIKRITVQPGEREYEAPEKVEGMFNKAGCQLGKPTP